MNRYRRRIIVRGQRGQVMLIFALVAVVLFAILGLAIDSGLAYLSSDQVERAAAASALAGVAYLPGEYPTGQNVALVEAARNGFANNPANGNGTSCVANTYPCVTASRPATNQLKVTISVEIPTTFLQLIGFPHTVITRYATAEYLPPIALGQPGQEQGSTLDSSCDGIGGAYCSTGIASGLGSGGNNYYFERTEGWGNPRSEGDAFTPTPDDDTSSCSGSCKANPPDVHEISPWEGSELNYESYLPGTYHTFALNYTGGYNYLVTLAPGQQADVQVFNPAFAPDTSNDATTAYSYHEDDTAFLNQSTQAPDYSAMAYTLFEVPTLSSDDQDLPISQEIFYPYNATCLYDNGAGNGSECGTHGVSYWYFPPSGSGTQAWGPTGQVPATYHQWTSAIEYSPNKTDGDSALFDDSMPALGGPGGAYLTSSGYLTNTSSVTEYFRLEVDTLTWNGQPTCTSSSCSDPDGGTADKAGSSDGASYAHKGYAVQVVGAPGTTGMCSTSSECSISALGDMTVYTPIYNTTNGSAQFSIPLFQLDQAYANHTIDVDLFDPGDITANGCTTNCAAMGIMQPDGSWATAASITDLGTSIRSGNTSSVNPDTAECSSACFTTANSGVLYNGQWIQVQVQVPANYTDSTGYWDLVYSVAKGVQAGDTFSVQVSSAGSPDHLLP